MKPWWRRWFGTRSERAAEAHLRREGMRVVARNVVAGGGEIDLVAVEGRTVVFVEVRSTEDEDLSRPNESVDSVKQAKVSEAAVGFLKAKRLLDHQARFDVLLVSWPPGAREPRIEHVRQAFQAVGRWQMHS